MEGDRLQYGNSFKGGGFMLIQRITRILGRLICYTLLVLLLGAVIYTLSTEKWLGSLISVTLFLLILYNGLIRLKIPGSSVLVHDGKVVSFIPEKTICNRFDLVTSGQTVVELPRYGLLDRPYKLELFSPDKEGGLYSCRLSLQLDYDLDPAALQRSFDCFIRYQDKMLWEVKRVLMKSAAGLVCRHVPLESVEAIQEYLKPLVAELNTGLESVGLKIEEASCSFTAGSTLVRFVAAEQDVLEKALASAQ